MIIFQIRDFISVLFYRTFCSTLFKKFGSKVRIIFPLRIVGSKFITIGNNVTIQFGAYVAVISENNQPILEIQNGSLIGNYFHIICTGKIVIKENVLIADKVYISDNLHNYENINIPILEQDLIQMSEIEIGQGSWIGENVCIIGASIGKNCVIGANSVVTKSIPDYTIAVGAPAVPIKRFCLESKTWKRTDKNGNFSYNVEN